MIVCRSYIAGEWVASKKARNITMHNPANLEQAVSEVEYLAENRIDYAIESAESAFRIWRNFSIVERIQTTNNFLEEIKTSRDQIAEIITLENGKTLRESYAEINSGLNEAYYQLNHLGDTFSTKQGKCEICYEPLGVALLITPWNFPFATIMRKLIPALVTGNSIIIKPSELTPLTSVTLFELIDKLGFPKGSLNLILGDGSVGKQLTGSSKISAISLTGSSYTGSLIKQQIAHLNTRLQAEMGGKNTVAVLPDADIEKAAKDIVSNAYACCGQWCTGTSKVVVHTDVADKLIDAIVELTKKIKLGSGLNDQTDMGPLISKAQLHKTKSAAANAEGAKLLIGGKQPEDEEFSKGYFFEPTIFSEVDPDSKLAQEEIFGPVLSIIIEDNIDDIIRIVNNSKYGLSFSVYTKDELLGERFVSKVDAGLCHINLPTAHRDPSLPLLGWKNSGFGFPESGPTAFEFFTRTKAVYRNI